MKPNRSRRQFVQTGGALLVTAISTLPLSAWSATVAASDPKLAEVTAAIERSARWQLANPSGTDTRDWVIAPLYDGLIAAGLSTGQARYLVPVVDLGTQSGWMPGGRVYFADDHAVGHAWIDLYLFDRSRPERLAPMRDRMSAIIAKPVTEILVYHQPAKMPGHWFGDRWTWCDALYMGPPTLARLFTATGDKKYLDFMDSEFKATVDHLWDPQERLFFRDASFFTLKSKNGKKVFWSRGNGWVYAGLAQVLDQLPPDHPTRPYYTDLFRQMTGAILATQHADGLWRPSLLDPAETDIGETSGSGFFIYGLAWGINQGLLPRDGRHWGAITRGWRGLQTRIKPDGYVGYVQPISSGPKFETPQLSAHQTTPAAVPRRIDENARQDYGTGAFLLAGAELLRALGRATTKTPAQVMAEAQALYDAQARTPRALARLVPERLEDLAWENDKVAFRIYGPPLRESVEDSGIDAWFKRVPYPVLNSWYAQSLGPTGKSYHVDHGEGYDGFHTGDTRGVGGLGLWIDGKLISSDTYTQATIHWTGPEVAEFSNVFAYPVKFKGQTVYEHRYTRLRLGERLSEINSFFSTDNSPNAKPIRDFPHEIAIGLVTQDADKAAIHINAAVGTLAVTEPIGEHQLGTGVLIDPARVRRGERLPAPAQAPKNAHGLLIAQVDSQGYLRYRAGFAWSGDDDIRNAQEWTEYLAGQAVKR